jgi:hypothetical protein
MPLSVKEIKEAAMNHLKYERDGIQRRELEKRVQAVAKNTPWNTIRAALSDLDKKNDEIMHPIRGLWILRKYAKAKSE